ncbi:MAG: hypothetical protein LBC35_08470 [Coriobacteriales bacterium]|nr:hypothetical protein [Coriobacteriales bacterium]
MFENDYIMRMILQLTRALRKSLNRQFPTRESELDDIEGRVAEAAGLDPRLMFKLEPESLVSVLELGNFDAALAGYVVRSLYYEASLLEEDGQLARADLRYRQGDAIADRFGIPVTKVDLTPATLEEFLDEHEESDRQDERDARGVALE